HKQYRHMLDPVFTSKRIEPLGAQVHQLANELIDGFIAKGECDAYHEWCEPLPSIIFLSIMGLPLAEYANFHNFKNLILGNADLGEITPEERMKRTGEAVMWLQNYFNADLDAREQEATPRDDMISWLLTAEVDGHRLGRTEMLDILGLLMIAGLDTVAASLGCFLSYLARNPDQRQLLVADPSLTRSAIEELMRYECPVTEGYRVATADVDLPSGVHVPAGSWMLISWSGANLDPAVFTDALTVDFERKPNAHIGFASGFHRCLGSHLARLELSVALNAWHARIPDYRIADGVELVYSGNPRAPHRLPLVWS
ncbi:MAG: cytochrome P450, partial [Actinomycetota bacterium]|nr:cytochrome P450 [Actinomycetota bacterium]